MIRLRDITLPVAPWAEAARTFTLPPVSRYHIATDCLRHDPARTALILVDDPAHRRVSFGELDQRSARLATALVRLGLRAGDRVAVWLSQSEAMATSVLAALRAGAVVVPISTVLGEDSVRHRLTDSDARVVIAEGSDRQAGLAAEVGATLLTTADAGGGRRLADVIAATEPAGPALADAPADAPALLLYTSGTTGKSKGVLHGHRVLLGHYGVGYAMDLVRPDDVAYSPVDWAWAGGLFLGLLFPLAHGIPVVVHRAPRFDPARILALLRDCRVSVGLFPPTALRLLRSSGEVTPRVAAGLRLRCLVTGAEAVEPELSGWVREELHATLNNAFGQTEANALIGHSGVLGRLDPACLGRAYPGRRIALLDDDLRPVSTGEPGQIAVRADDPVCMLEYWRAPAATAAKVRGGWLLTGDIAHADAEGQFYFHGRDDDIIKSGGYRLGPAEVEAAILRQPGVAGCAVVGLPDPVRGQVVTAFVQLHAGQPSEDLSQRLQERVRAEVGAHAYPRTVHYVQSLPRTTTGKVDRAALRRTALAARDHQQDHQEGGDR